MRRRTFLAGLGFAALQLAGCAAKLQTTPDYVLTYADNQPAGYPTTQGAQYFADLVQQQTGGKVVIQVKANGEYGSEQQVWEQLAIGGVDFARVSLSVATDDLPRLNVLLLPYLYRDADHMWRVLDGSIGAEFLQDFTAQGRVGLSWYDACPLVLCPPAGAQPERSAGQDHPRAGFADRDRHDPPAGCSAGDHGVQRCVLGA